MRFIRVQINVNACEKQSKRDYVNELNEQNANKIQHTDQTQSV